MNWLFFFIIVGVIIFREPRFFTFPRFWAEEGQMFFSQALQEPWYMALFHPFFDQGYYSFLIHLTTVVAANFVSLPLAPIVTTGMAFLVMLIPIALILWGNSNLFPYQITRWLAVLVVVFVPLNSEIWLNTTNVQFTLVVIATLILVQYLKNAGRLRIWVYRALLLIAGLAGVLSDLLLPLFIWKALKYKLREYKIQAGILAATTLVQLSIFLYSLKYANLASRLVAGDLPTLGSSVLLRMVLVPLVGIEPASQWARTLLELRSSQPLEFAYMGYGCLLVLLVIGLLFLWPVRNRAISWLLLALATITVFSFFFSINRGDRSILIYPNYAERYFYAPTILFYLLFIFGIIPSARSKSNFRSFLCLIIVSAAILRGMLIYPSTAGYRTDYPSWNQAVENYYHDPAQTRLPIWPAGAWYVEMGDHRR